MLLGYRYWTDEPGNDVMWFWSENHALCFHTAQYLAGQLFPDALFANSGRTGVAQAEIGRQRLEAWLADIEANGFIEWNSPAYYPIDAIGLLALYELAEDVGIRRGGRALPGSHLHDDGAQHAERHPVIDARALLCARPASSPA